MGLRTSEGEQAERRAGVWRRLLERGLGAREGKDRAEMEEWRRLLKWGCARAKESRQRGERRESGAEQRAEEGE